MSEAMSSHCEQFSPLWGFTVLAALFYVCMEIGSWLIKSEASTVGRQSVFEARMVSNFRFYKNAEAILVEGYTKVCRVKPAVKLVLTYAQFKDKIFQFRRVDADMLVLPPKYVNDMRVLPPSIASPTVAHAHNLMGSHTNMNIILRNNLHFRTLQLKLTPNLGSLTDPMKDELDYAIQKDMPACESKEPPLPQRL